MPRKYTLGRRAEKQADTRRRIVEAAIGLHETVGPAATTFSMLAEKAGVQRHTLYAHFPDERSLLVACSGLHLELNPLPDADAWRAMEDPGERLRLALTEIYTWYERNEGMTACVLRDAEYHAPTREIAEMRMAPHSEVWHLVLGEGLTPAGHAMLALALSFHSWRTLQHEAGLSRAEAVEAMARAVDQAG